AGLNPQQFRFLLDYSAQQASGIGAWARDAEHMEKAFLFGGKPAAAGVTTAMLIRSGWTGVDDVFSGPDNFFDAYAPRENGALKADASQLINRLGERYEITRPTTKARMQDPAVLRQRAKVEVVADPPIDARRPRREAIVELTLADGAQLSEWIRDVRGTAENPMTRDEVVAKARDLITPVLGAAACS